MHPIRTWRAAGRRALPKFLLLQCHQVTPHFLEVWTTIIAGESIGQQLLIRDGDRSYSIAGHKRCLCLFGLSQRELHTGKMAQHTLILPFKYPRQFATMYVMILPQQL